MQDPLLNQQKQNDKIRIYYPQNKYKIQLTEQQIVQKIKEIINIDYQSHKFIGIHQFREKQIKLYFNNNEKVDVLVLIKSHTNRIGQQSCGEQQVQFLQLENLIFDNIIQEKRPYDFDRKQDQCYLCFDDQQTIYKKCKKNCINKICRSCYQDQIDKMQKTTCLICAQSSY